MKLKVALIGLGTVSHIHKYIVEKSEYSEIVALCDIDESKKIDGYNFYTDYKEMIDKEEIDVVHVLLPHYLHIEVTKYCVKNNIHVLLEKPIGVSYKEAKDLADFIEDYPDVKVAVCLQNRLNDCTKFLVKLVDNKRLGELVGIKGNVSWFRPKEYYTEAPWRGTILEAGSGVMINQAIHTIDLMYLIAGKAESLKGGMDNIYHDYIEVEDFAYANIEYKNNVKGLFTATTANTTNSSVYLVAYFENGELIIQDNKLYLKDYMEEEPTKQLLVEDEKLPGSKFYYGAGHNRYINGFYQDILNDTSNYIKVKDALEMHRIIDGIKLSHETHQRVYLKDLED